MRGPVVQFRVRTPGVIELDPVLQSPTNFVAGLEGVQIDAFILFLLAAKMFADSGYFIRLPMRPNVLII